MTPLAILVIAGAISAVGSVNLRGIPITRDGTVFSGDRIQVGPASYARLSVGKGVVLEAGAGADLTLTLEGKEMRVRVASGTVAFRDRSGKSGYLTPDGVTSLDMGEPSTNPTGTIQPQAGRSKRAWLGIAGILGGTAAAAAILISRNDDTNEAATARLERAQFLSSLEPISAVITVTASNASKISTTTTNAVSAIQAANIPLASKASLLAQSAAVIARANDSVLRTASLSAALASLEQAIALQPGGPTAAQQQMVLQLVNELNANRFAVNEAYLGLLAILKSATELGVPNLPVAPDIQTIPPPDLASPSAPS
jgi:hypothetical protein